CEPSLPLRKMLPHFPDFIHPLLEALMEEINQMITRTRRKAQQNFLLLSRTMELTQETLRALQPENYTKTYSKKGRVGVTQRMPSRYKAFV
ncbi:MAG: flagellar export chaperone FlgN, partial [Verrucomicrobiota bacterium]